MTPLRAILIGCAIVGHLVCMVITARGADPYPAGTITRIYAGDVSGSMAGITQAGTCQAEITGTPEAFANTTSAAFIVRGQLVDPPLFATALRGRWSNYIRVNATGWPFRAVAAWEDGSGLVLAFPAADWSTITAEATGAVQGVAVALHRTTIALVETRTNASANVETNAPANADAIAIGEWHSLGPHRLDPRKMRITRQLYSADNRGDKVHLSFEPLGWSAQTGGNGKTVDGAVCIVWQDGTGYIGGHFDWHGKGQTDKTQANIPAGYLDGRQPPRGAPVWYFLCNRDYTERTNIMPGGNW